MNSEKILDILEKSKGYDIALLSTFNFEVDFFERSIMNRLINNGIKKISVFVDSQELAKAVNSIYTSSIGKKYAVNPVVMRGSFHPKVILLLAEKKARIIIGSANLKLSGYYINNEIFNYVDYDIDHSEYRDIIFYAMDFFLMLHENNIYTYQLDDKLIKELKQYRYYRSAPNNEKISFLHNLNTSVLSQVQNIISGTVRAIHIAVPYYDNNLSGLQTLRNIYREADIHLYLQQGKSTFPEEKYKISKCADHEHVFESLLYYEGNDKLTKNNRFYHGKVILFKTDSYSYILYGSSNCTQSALTRTIDTGNVECNLLEKGEKDTYDAFFEGFEILDTKDIESHIMHFEPSPQNNYYFMYGAVDGMIVKLHIGYYKKEKKAAFYYKESPLKWEEKEKGHIVVELEVPEETIFDIQVESTKSKEYIRCWYNDYRILELFRMNSTQRVLNDKFKEEYEKYFQAELTCVEDIDEWKRVYQLVTRQTEERETDVAEATEEDYIVYVDITDDDYDSFQKYKIVEHIRGRIKTRYLTSMKIPSFYSSYGNKNKTIGSSLKSSKEELQRKATTEEKSFERFVKRKVRDIQDGYFVDQIDYDHYFGLVISVLEIINESRERDDLVEDIFPDSYIVQARTGLLKKLITKSNVSDTNDTLISLVLYAILDSNVKRHNCSSEKERSNYETLNEQLLSLLDKKFAIRSNYEEYLCSIEENSDSKETSERIRGAKEYIENLFGYKSLPQIESYIENQYGADSKLEIKKTTARITIHTETPRDFFKPDERLVRDIFNYSTHVYKLKYLRIIVISTAITNIKEIEHSIDLDYHKLRRTTTGKDGRKTADKPTYYYF